MPTEIEGGAPETAEKSGWSLSKKVCVCLTWSFLAFAIAWATGVHELLIFLATEHYALTAGVVSVILCFAVLDSSDNSKASHYVFVTANIVLAASILHGLVWGWGSILLYDEIYGVKFLVPAVPALAVEAGIAAVIVCAIWHSKDLDTVTDRIIGSGFFVLVGTGLVFVVAIGFSVLADAERKANEERQASRPLTQEQRTEISNGAWNCKYNSLTRVATCEDD